MNPSKYQERVYNHVAHEIGCGIVGAVAGSGKTTTLYGAAKRVPLRAKAIALAFNKLIAKHMAKKFQGTAVEAKTNHALGYRILAKHLGGGLELDGDKYYKLIKERNPQAHREWHSLLKKYVDLVRLTLTDWKDPIAFAEMQNHFGLDDQPDIDDRHLDKLENQIDLLTEIEWAINEGAAIAGEELFVDFTDMLYLPIMWDTSIPKYDYIFVDECQDLSALQLEVIKRSLYRDGRVLAVGDEKQSLYGWCGADNESFCKVQTAFNAIEMPLSICYRCPSSHLDLARRIVPQIEAAPGAEKGVVGFLSEHEVMTRLVAQDLVLCRSTAPLVSLCIKLISNKIPAVVKGKDIGKQLVTLARRVSEIKGFQFDDFSYYLSAYCNKRAEKLAKKDKFAQIEALRDQQRCLNECFDAFDPMDFSDFAAQVNNLFSDINSLITLSTVHRAKGLEADRVFILRPESMPLCWPNQKEWEAVQEMNIKYVALTRAKKELYFVKKAVS